MTNSLLKKLALPLAVAAVLQGCGSESGEGLDLNFSSSQPVTYTEGDLSITLSEDAGSAIMVDLLEGAMVGDVALVDAEGAKFFVREMEFTTPDHDSFRTPQTANEVIDSNNQTNSPFSMAADGRHLVIDTTKFVDRLRMCDATDNESRLENGNFEQTPDGLRDYPSLIKYELTYLIDNGYKYPSNGGGINGTNIDTGSELPAFDENGVPNTYIERKLVITINAIEDLVTGVTASDLSLPIGTTTQMPASTTPYYACNKELEYVSADSNTALIDDDGMVTGAGLGTTSVTVTSVGNPNASSSADVTVERAFSISISNQDLDDLGAPSGEKQVATCTPFAVDVTPVVAGGSLSGTYAYDFTSDNTDVVFEAETATRDFTNFGRFTNNLAAGESAEINVALTSGDTGATALADVLGKTVTVTAADSIACDPAAGPYNSDLQFDGHGKFWETWPSAVSTAQIIPDAGVDGNGALEITASTDAGVDFGAVQTLWNETVNFYASTFAIPEAVGNQYKFSVWVKLAQLPEEGETVTVRHILTDWNCSTCTGPGGFDARWEQSGSQLLLGELKPTTDWQYVELMDNASQTNVWTVPTTWGVAGGDAMAMWGVTGLKTGESIQLDAFGIVEVD